MAGMVAEGGPLWVAEQGEHGAVQIQNQPRSAVRLMSEELQQSIIQGAQLIGELDGSTEQESSQRLGVGEAGQAGQILKGAVRTQQRCGLDAIQAQNQRPGQRQHHLRQAIVMVASNPVQIAGQEMSQLQHSKKFVNEECAAIARQTRMAEGDSHISWGAAHCAVS
jgi:hypothetical protein